MRYPTDYCPTRASGNIPARILNPQFSILWKEWEWGWTRKHLGIGNSGQMVPWRSRQNVTTLEGSRVCSVISAYRLLMLSLCCNDARTCSSRGETILFSFPKSKLPFVVQCYQLFTLMGSAVCREWTKWRNWPQVLQGIQGCPQESPRRQSRFPPEDLSTPFAYSVWSAWKQTREEF